MALSDLPPLVEVSHEKERLALVRLSDVGTVPTGEDRRRDHEPSGQFAKGNRAAAGRAAKRALTAPLRAARKRVQLALGAECPSATDELLSDAMSIYSSSKLDLGSRSVLVLGPLVTHATETVLAGFFARRAAELGLESEEAGRLLGLAHACETQATRALTAALAACKGLAGRKDGQADPHKAVLDAFGESAPGKGSS